MIGRIWSTPIGLALCLALLGGCGGGSSSSTSGTGTSSSSSADNVDLDTFTACMKKGGFPLRSGKSYYTNFEGYSYETTHLRESATDVLAATNVEVKFRTKGLPPLAAAALKDPSPQALVLFTEGDDSAGALAQRVPSDAIVGRSHNVVWIFGTSSHIPVKQTQDMAAFKASAKHCANDSVEA